MAQAQAMTADELRAYVATLEAQNTTLQAKLLASANTKLTLKVSPKGALSAYGFGKWPVTLYAAQWERLLDNAVIIREFINANPDTLTRKA